MHEGPTHFDLTEEEESPKQQQNPQHSQPRQSSQARPQDIDQRAEEEIIEGVEPVRSQKPAFIFKLYSTLKKGGTPLNYIDEFLKEKGY